MRLERKKNNNVGSADLVWTFGKVRVVWDSSEAGGKF